MWYGWRITGDQLYNVGEYVRTRDKLPDKNDGFYTLQRDLAMNEFWKLTGVRNLQLKLGYPLGCDPWNPPCGFFLVLTVMDWSKESFLKRPTQAHLDRLAELMGRKPRWYLDARVAW